MSIGLLEVASKISSDLLTTADKITDTSTSFKTFDPDKRIDVTCDKISSNEIDEYDPDKRVDYSNGDNQISCKEKEYDPDDRINIIDPKELDSELKFDKDSIEEKGIDLNLILNEDSKLDNMPERFTSYEDRLKHTPNEVSDLGSWEGERGESKFIPNPNSETGCIAKNKLSEYGMDGVEYKYAEPDFSHCSEATVTIDNMTQNRENYIDKDGNYQLGNFAQADFKCADLWNSIGRDGKTDWSASDIREWRRENQYSWHECCDTSTMQLVSRDIHGTFKHSGGVAECKLRDSINLGDEFDE